MAHREKRHPITNEILGAEIDDTDSADEIRSHAQAQANIDPADPKEVGLILVQLIKPGVVPPGREPYSRWLTYTSRTRVGGSPRGFEISEDVLPPGNRRVDKVETITNLHHNGWCIRLPNGMWIWIC